MKFFHVLSLAIGLVANVSCLPADAQSGGASPDRQCRPQQAVDNNDDVLVARAYYHTRSRSKAEEQGQQIVPKPPADKRTHLWKRTQTTMFTYTDLAGKSQQGVCWKGVVQSEINRLWTSMGGRHADIFLAASGDTEQKVMGMGWRDGPRALDVGRNGNGAATEVYFKGYKPPTIGPVGPDKIMGTPDTFQYIGSIDPKDEQTLFDEGKKINSEKQEKFDLDTYNCLTWIDLVLKKVDLKKG